MVLMWSFSCLDMFAKPPIEKLVMGMAPLNLSAFSLIFLILFHTMMGICNLPRLKMADHPDFLNLETTFVKYSQYHI
jgi:hypothetical protein